MLNASLRRSGGSFIMTVPLAYIEQNHLTAGSRMAIEIMGDELKIRPQRPRRSLCDLLAATPPGLCRADGWDEMGAAGAEL
ncbi:MAG: AbrB/MazE/SpoVT family DNA-binding domain-containing protein [Comamonadaceae bacterium CG_4_9_14_0_8_um_filter_57_21]|nr:MAG: AbrB/MazE/SpoVT family DNA-binding domain-containing protein [Comamonadaceae bacterium CG_4_9_14_0_8_um_filter_57_21]